MALLIAAADDDEHDAIFQQVIERALQANIQFNKDKIQYKVSSVLFMGSRVTADGLQPDEAKVRAIKNMPPPDDKEGLQRFLDVIKYLTLYIRHESTIMAPLRQLLKQDVEWAFSARAHESSEQNQADPDEEAISQVL